MTTTMKRVREAITGEPNKTATLQVDDSGRVRLRILQSFTSAGSTAWGVGQVANIPENTAAEWVADGRAIAVPLDSPLEQFINTVGFQTAMRRHFDVNWKPSGATTTSQSMVYRNELPETAAGFITISHLAIGQTSRMISPAAVELVESIGTSPRPISIRLRSNVAVRCDHHEAGELVAKVEARMGKRFHPIGRGFVDLGSIDMIQTLQGATSLRLRSGSVIPVSTDEVPALDAALATFTAAQNQG